MGIRPNPTPDLKISTVTHLDLYNSILTLRFDLSVIGCITSLHNAIPETFRMLRSRLYPDVGWNYVDFCAGNST